jgi:hypothetical protein
MREHKPIFMREIARLFEEHPDIDPRARQYFKWLYNFEYLDRKSTEFALRERYRSPW